MWAEQKGGLRVNWEEGKGDEDAESPQRLSVVDVQFPRGRASEFVPFYEETRQSREEPLAP